MLQRDNETKQDAFLRVLDAQMGCFVNTTPEYLHHLRHRVVLWLDSIDREIEEQARQEARHADPA